MFDLFSWAYPDYALFANFFQGFTLDNSRDAIQEVIGLINDAIDIVGYTVQRPQSKEEYVQRSMVFLVYHILQPSCYAIYLNLMAANLPTCFVELRLLLESLVKCYLADVKYSDKPFFQEKIAELDQTGRNISKLMRELETALGSGEDFSALWSETSENWVHTKGFVDNIVKQVVGREDVPPWALAVPMNFAQGDLDSINRLREEVSRFRNLLKISMKAYWQEPGIFKA